MIYYDYDLCKYYDLCEYDLCEYDSYEKSVFSLDLTYN